MNTKYYVILIAAIFMASYFAGNIITRDDQYNAIDVPAQYMKSACNPVQTACEISLAGNVISYRITGSLSALQKFKVEVQALDIEIEDIQVKFLMPGMNMGKNDYALVNKQGSIWTQDVILPVCSLSRKDWISQLEIRYSGRIWNIEFSLVQQR